MATFTIDKQTYRTIHRRLTAKFWIFPASILFFIGLQILLPRFRDGTVTSTHIIILLTTAVLMVVSVNIGMNRGIDNRYENQKDFQHPIELKVNSDGVIWKTIRVTLELGWNEFQKLQERDGYYLIFFSKYEFLIVDKSALSDEEETLIRKNLANK